MYPPHPSHITSLHCEILMLGKLTTVWTSDCEVDVVINNKSQGSKAVHVRWTEFFQQLNYRKLLRNLSTLNQVLVRHVDILFLCISAVCSTKTWRTHSWYCMWPPASAVAAANYDVTLISTPGTYWYQNDVAKYPTELMLSMCKCTLPQHPSSWFLQMLTFKPHVCLFTWLHNISFFRKLDDHKIIVQIF